MAKARSAWDKCCASPLEPWTRIPVTPPWDRDSSFQYLIVEVLMIVDVPWLGGGHVPE